MPDCVEIGAKGVGSGDGLDVWGGNGWLVVWLKHCFGVLVIIDCCFVAIVQVTGAMRLNMDFEFCLCGVIVCTFLEMFLCALFLLLLGG